MLLRHEHLRRRPAVFRALTGLRVETFAILEADLLPRFAEAEYARLARPDRVRAVGAGGQPALGPRDQLLLTVVWLRRYPTNEVLGYLFGVSDSTASRVIARWLPLLAASGQDRMRLPDPGRKHRRQLDDLLADTPDLAVLIDTFEQPVQRPRDRAEADGYYSGKKRRHTLKVQVAVDEVTGAIVDVADSQPGPTADITLVARSRVLERLPAGVGAAGDLAYVGMDKLHPRGQGATPRRKPRGRDRPPADVAYNRAFARRRVRVEHAIGQVRLYQAVTQVDRHHRRDHTARVRAAAGLVNLRQWRLHAYRARQVS
jgi:DDE superfamily endonuclease/Helix-turn-helix of DDE superfamily endonuclease